MAQAIEPLDGRLLDAEEVAALLSMSERWVRERTRAGVVPTSVSGRSRRYVREDVLDWPA